MERRGEFAIDHLGYRPQLDGIRAVAIAAVVWTHSVQVFAPRWTDLLPGGFAGVHLFFVLSGFLITSLLLEEWQATRAVSIRSFYARRGLRLLPALVGMLCFQVGYSVATGVAGTTEWRSLGMVVLYISNFGYAFSSVSPGLGHTWSLAVEEQFYLLWPLVLLMVLRRRRWRGVILALTAGAMLVSTLDSIVSWSVDPTWYHIYTRTDINAVALLAGVSLAFIMRRGVPTRLVRRAALMGWTVFGLFLVFVTSDEIYLGGLLVVSMASAAMIAGATTQGGPFASALTHRATAWIGRRSYGLYLWHVPVIVAVDEQARALPATPRAAVAISLALAATALSYRFVETPFLRRKARMSVSV